MGPFFSFGFSGGLWEISSTIDMPGMPHKIPPSKVTHCYTKEDMRSNKSVPQQKGDCKLTDQNFSGNRMTWKMVCSGAHPSKSEGEITYYGATAYEGNMKMVAEGMTMNTKYKARRIGVCK
ncbi:MAG TPA: DUF3617 family protein [Geobacteraceae bacterium]|nr:DUF3617 family protein [Geobacteraceae bacterium]